MNKFLEGLRVQLVKVVAVNGEWYTWEPIRRHGYDSLMWGPDGSPMPVIRVTIRELLLIGRWK